MRLVVVSLVAAVVGGAVGAAMVYAIDGQGGSTAVAQPTPQSDRVVNVVRKCEVPANGATIEMFDTACAQMPTLTHLTLTIRTSTGSAYTLDAPISTSVAVGDPWPK